MKEHESAYYEYQTKARGLLDRNALQVRFKKLSRWYTCRLKSYLPLDKQAACLDLPCGYGNFLYFLKSHGYKNISGFDLDGQQINLAQLLDLPAKTGDVFEVLENDDVAYDLISSMDFIEHLEKDAALKFLGMCFDRLNSGGKLIIRTPCADGPFGSHDICNDLTHKWGMTANVLQTILEMLGFSEVKVLDERPQPTSVLDFIRWVMFFPAKVFVEAVCVALGLMPPRIWTRSMIAVASKLD